MRTFGLLCRLFQVNQQRLTDMFISSRRYCMRSSLTDIVHYVGRPFAFQKVHRCKGKTVSFAMRIFLHTFVWTAFGLWSVRRERWSVSASDAPGHVGTASTQPWRTATGHGWPRRASTASAQRSVVLFLNPWISGWDGNVRQSIRCGRRDPGGLDVGERQLVDRQRSRRIRRVCSRAAGNHGDSDLSAANRRSNRNVICRERLLLDKTTSEPWRHSDAVLLGRQDVLDVARTSFSRRKADPDFAEDVQHGRVG